MPFAPRLQLKPGLSWTHYRLLLSVENDVAREWYLNEAADQHWSTRQLERQISVLYYERLLSSRKKAPVRKEAAANSHHPSSICWDVIQTLLANRDHSRRMLVWRS